MAHLPKFKFPERLKSRKFWLAVVSALVVFGNKAFDWNLDEKEVLTIVGSLLSFVLVEGAADAVRASK